MLLLFCVATVCFCYNIPYGCQGVAMQLSRCSECCCCFFVLLKYVFVIIFRMVATVLLCSYQGVLSVGVVFFVLLKYVLL